MKRLTTAAICIATALTTWAQQSPQPGAPSDPNKQQQTGLQTGARQSGLQQDSSQRGPITVTPNARSESIYSATGRDTAHGSKQVRASKIIGADVKTSSGESLGKIEDLVLNPASGRAEFAVINWENKLVPVPFRALRSDHSASVTTTPGQTPGITASAGMDRLSFTAQIEKDKLQSAPTISDRTRWSELQQSGFSQRIYTHYGIQAQGVGAPGTGIERGPGSDTEDKDDSKLDSSKTQKSSNSSSTTPPDANSSTKSPN